jgi:hypothetical protein
MFIPERYRRNPPWRRPSTEPPPDDANTLEPDVADEPTDPDEPEDAELSDGDFLRGLRADVEGVREGIVPSITDAIRPSPQDRPWGRRHKRRDRDGRAF